MISPEQVREIRRRHNMAQTSFAGRETFDRSSINDVADLLAALEDAIVEVDCHPRHSRAVTYGALLAALREPLT